MVVFMERMRVNAVCLMIIYIIVVIMTKLSSILSCSQGLILI